MGFVNEVRARPPATRQGTFQPHVLRPVPFSRRNICSLQYLIPEACGRALGWPLVPVRSGGLLSGRKNDRRPQGTWTWPLRRAVDGAARALAVSGTGSLVPAPAARLPRPRQTGRRTQASWRPEHLRGSHVASYAPSSSGCWDGGGGRVRPPVCSPLNQALPRLPVHTRLLLHPGHQARRSGHRTREGDR